MVATMVAIMNSSQLSVNLITLTSILMTTTINLTKINILLSVNLVNLISILTPTINNCTLIIMMRKLRLKTIGSIVTTSVNTIVKLFNVTITKH